MPEPEPEEVITAPPQSSADDEGAKLEKMAAAMDAGEEVKPEIKTVEGEPVKPDEVKPDAAKPDVAPPDAKKGERPRGPDGKFLKPEPVAKPDSKFEAAKKDQERQDRSWQALDKEKAETRALAQKLAEEKRVIDNARAQQRPEATLHGYTAREYVDFVKQSRANGDYENAFKGIEAIEQIRAFEAQYFAEQNQKAYEGAFNADMDSVLKEHRELQDQNTPEAQAVSKVLEVYPQIFYLEKPFSKAWDLAQKFMAAESADTSKARIAELEGQLAKFMADTQPGAGGPSAPAGPRKFSEMSSAEQESSLLRQINQADQMAA